MLSYRMIGEEGPDHDKTFRAQVLLNDQPVGTGSGHSKRRRSSPPPKTPSAAWRSNDVIPWESRFGGSLAFGKYRWNFCPNRAILTSF